MDNETKGLMSFVNVLGFVIFVLITAFHWAQSSARAKKVRHVAG